MTGVAIFGATSAIAEATARTLAGPDIRFFLAARSAEKLERMAARILTARGAAGVKTSVYDFTNHEGLETLVGQAAQELGGIDRALIAFGTLTDQAKAESVPAYAAAEIDINFIAPAILTQHLANLMTARQTGYIAVITSVAGDRGRLSNYVYGSAKRGLGLYLQGLRHKLAAKKIEVLDIRPGFVDTPMTRDFPKGPLWAKPETVGAAIAKAMQVQKGGQMYVPCFWALIMFIIRNVPAALFHKTKL